MESERTDGDDDDDVLLLESAERAVDDAGSRRLVDGGGARFSFCNSFRCDVPLIIVALNCAEGE